MNYYSVVTFKEFLYNKFNNISFGKIREYYTSLVNNLPKFAIGNEDNVMWGFESSGFWYISENEAHFFENDGTFHLLSANINGNHYQIFKDLYEASINDNDCNFKIVNPLEFDTLTITNDKHFSLPKNTTLHYIKFQMPINGYGITFDMLSYDAQSSKDEGKFKINEFIDQTTWIFSTLKNLGHPFPVIGKQTMSISFDDRMIDGDNYIFYKFSKFDLSLNDAIDSQMAELENQIHLTEARFNKSLSDYISYARTKWLPLKI